ncbi:MAG TPA: alpha/beta hydrolase [Thermoleophilaceae bacterium]
MTATLTAHHVVSADGTAIGARVTGAGSPFVLVHGSAADGTRWAPIREQLAERFEVHAIDRRGRGLSGDAGAYSIAREYEDVAAYVDALGEPAVVLGHSYGAVVALEAAGLMGNLAALVLYEPPFPVGLEIYDPGVVARLETLLAAGDRDELLATFMREVPRVPESHIETMRGQATWAARVAAAHTIPRELRAVNELEGGIRERFAGVDVPTLLLVGGASPAFLTEPSRALAETLTKSEVAVFDGHAHSAMDTATDEFVERVLDFARS